MIRIIFRLYKNPFYLLQTNMEKNLNLNNKQNNSLEYLKSVLYFIYVKTNMNIFNNKKSLMR